jgi:hypothetical protein
MVRHHRLPEPTSFRSSIPSLQIPLSNASSAAARLPSHGSGPEGFVIPSLYDSFIRYSMSVYRDAILTARSAARKARPMGTPSQSRLPRVSHPLSTNIVARAIFFAAWGEPTRPGFPFRETGKGSKIPSLLPQAMNSVLSPLHSLYSANRRLNGRSGPQPLGVTALVVSRSRLQDRRSDSARASSYQECCGASSKSN